VNFRGTAGGIGFKIAKTRVQQSALANNSPASRKNSGTAHETDALAVASPGRIAKAEYSISCVALLPTAFAVQEPSIPERRLPLIWYADNAGVFPSNASATIFDKSCLIHDQPGKVKGCVPPPHPEYRLESKHLPIYNIIRCNYYSDAARSEESEYS
jgi:hypothetical protein